MSVDNDPVDNDDDWLQALAGRTTRATSASAEGVRLRAALQRLPLEAIDAEPATSVSREERLLAMARRVGLLPAAATRRRQSTGWLALAASIAALSFAVLWWPRENTNTSVERGVATAIVTLTVPNAAVAQAALLGDLRRLGITARGYQMLGRFGVDADLPAPPAAELMAVLKGYGLVAPAGGALRVEFVAPTSP
jgi:hypothetical protein